MNPKFIQAFWFVDISVGDVKVFEMVNLCSSLRKKKWNVQELIEVT